MQRLPLVLDGSFSLELTLACCLSLLGDVFERLAPIGAQVGQIRKLDY